jgi:hypothetical protein
MSANLVLLDREPVTIGRRGKKCAICSGERPPWQRWDQTSRAENYRVRTKVSLEFPGGRRKVTFEDTLFPGLEVMGWTAPRSRTASMGHDGSFDHRRRTRRVRRWKLQLSGSI